MTSPATENQPTAQTATVTDTVNGQPATATVTVEPDDLAAQTPEALAKMIRDLRQENGKDRTAAKAKAAEDGAKAARDELTQSIGKALGLIKDDKDKIDPQQLQDALTQAQTEKREAAVELAVYRVAAKAGGDPDSLLDSRTFLAKVGTLDPSADDFSAKITKAVEEAVKGNAKLGAVKVAGPSGADFRGGSGEPKGKADNMHDAVMNKINAG